MKVALFTDTYKPQINGGASAVESIFNGLHELNHSAIVIAPRVKGEKSNEKIHRIPSLVFPFLREHRLANLHSRVITPEFLIKNKIDIIHSHMPFSIGFLAARLAKKTGIPIVHTYHTFFEQYIHYLKIPKMFGLQSVRKFSYLYCQKCDGIIVPTISFKVILESYGVTRPIDICPTGIKIDKFQKGDRNLWREKLRIPSSAKILLFAGRIGKEKNIEFLIELMPDLLKRMKNVYFIIAGDGPLKTKLKEYASSLGVSGRVRFLGYVPSDEMHNIYAAADLFVFSSVTETQGLVVLESMAMGVPVIAVPAYGIKDILNNGKGCYLANLNHREFTEKIILMLKKDNYTKMKISAIKYAGKFEIKNTTRQLVNIYKKYLR